MTNVRKVSILDNYCTSEVCWSVHAASVCAIVGSLVQVCTVIAAKKILFKTKYKSDECISLSYYSEAPSFVNKWLFLDFSWAFFLIRQSRNLKLKMKTFALFFVTLIALGNYEKVLLKFIKYFVFLSGATLPSQEIKVTCNSNEDCSILGSGAYCCQST